MEYFVYAVLLLVSGYAAYALSQKPPEQKIDTELQLPTNAEGRPRGWLFGRRWIKDPQVHGPFSSEVDTQTKDKVKTRRYLATILLEFTRGPVDKIYELVADEDKSFWDDQATANTTALIWQENLFGGKEGEGGIRGYMDIMFGRSDQAQNAYLLGLVGEPLSAFRDAFCVLFQHAFLTANTPVVKPIAADLERIVEDWEGGACWYPQKARIPQSGVGGGYELADTYTQTLDAVDDCAGNGLFGPNFVNTEGVHITGLDPTDVLRVTLDDGSGWSVVNGNSPAGSPYWRCTFYSSDENQSPSTGTTRHMDQSATPFGETGFDSAAEALDDANANYLPLDFSGSSEWWFWLGDPGDNSDNLGEMHFIVEHYTATSALVFDMNPAHMVYQMLTDTHDGASEPSAGLSEAGFTYAADLFHAERMGLSHHFRDTADVDEYIARICTHAGMVRSIVPETGEHTIIPIRDDYDVDDLDLIDDSAGLVTVKEWTDSADGEQYNELTIKYRDRADFDREATVTVQNLASIQEQGAIIAAPVRDFPMISYAGLAERVAARELKMLSPHLKRGVLLANRQAWDKVPGTVFRFQSDAEGIDEIVVRVIEFAGGTHDDGQIEIRVAQDIYTLDDSAYVTKQPRSTPAVDTAPAAVTVRDVEEAPYYALLQQWGTAETAEMAQTESVLHVIAAKPTPLSTGYDIWTREGAAAYLETGTERDFTPSALLTGALVRENTSNVTFGSGSGISFLTLPLLARLGTGAFAEFCRVDAFDAVTGTATLTRGILDTTPNVWANGTRIWFLDPVDWQLDTEIRDGADEVDAKLQTVAPGGVLNLDDATEDTVTIGAGGRHTLPYPPGYVRVNGAEYPAEAEGALTIEWAHRDAVEQGTDLRAQDAAGIGPEMGTTYSVWAYDDDTETLYDSDTGISGTSWAPVVPLSCNLRIEIAAVRDGFESWQRQARVVAYVATATVLDADGVEVEDTDGTTMEYP